MAEKASEWHEQVEFSELYFKEHTKCREAQRSGEIIQWNQNIKSEMSMAIGILDKDEIEEINKLKGELNFVINNYQNSLDFEEMTGKMPLDVMSQKLKSKAEEKLFEIEGKVDGMVNKHMPFLNLRKEVDISGM